MARLIAAAPPPYVLLADTLADIQVTLPLAWSAPTASRMTRRMCWNSGSGADAGLERAASCGCSRRSL